MKDKLNRLSTEHKDLHVNINIIKVGVNIKSKFYKNREQSVKLAKQSTETSFTITSQLLHGLSYFKKITTFNFLIEILLNIFIVPVSWKVVVFLTLLYNNISSSSLNFKNSGMNDVAERLANEAQISKNEISEEPFAIFYSIYEEILRKNLRPAIEWVEMNSEELKNKNSSIEFKLHRLAFLQIIINGGIAAQNDAVVYARNHLSKFINETSCFTECNKYLKEFQSLMGCLLFLKVGIENSPYKHFLREEMWIEVADVFLKDACNLLGINKDSSLHVIVNAGCQAMPALLNLKQWVDLLDL